MLHLGHFMLMGCRPRVGPLLEGALGGRAVEVRGMVVLREGLVVGL